MGIRSWSQTGYSYHHNTTAPTSLTTSFQAFEVTQDTTNNTNSNLFPDSGHIETVEFDFTVKGDATSVTMYLARDSNGDCAITSASASGATENLTAGGSAGTAHGVFIVDNDYNHDDSVANTTPGSIYVMAKVDDQNNSPKANIRVNWRR